jgi:3-methyladenine DNA glycosylase/8-oxoguanine DNA glycosylase
MEKAIEFILKQQSQFSVDIQRINETLDRHNEVFRNQTDALVVLTGWHGKLVEAQIKLTEVQQGHDARIATIETKIAEIVDAGKRTDERLDALITTVERYISSRDGERGGKRRGRRPAK